jgi:hypothetical protein
MDDDDYSIASRDRMGSRVAPRPIDPLRLQGSLTSEEAAARHRTVNEWLEAIDLVLLRSPSSAARANRCRCHSARSTLCTSLPL